MPLTYTDIDQALADLSYNPNPTPPIDALLVAHGTNYDELMKDDPDLAFQLDLAQITWMIIKERHGESDNPEYRQRHRYIKDLERYLVNIRQHMEEKGAGA